MPGDPSDVAEEVRWSGLLRGRLPGLVGYWDRDLRNVFANHAYVDYWGRTPQQVKGCHLREVLGEPVYTLNLPYIQGVLAGREQSFSRNLTDSRGVTRYTHLTYIPNVVDGRVDGFFAVAIDVTERVEAEQARAESLRMFQIMVANAPFGKAILDTAGRVLHINPALCEVLGCDPEGLVGEDFRRFVHPDEVAASEAELEELVNGAAPKVSSEHRYVRVDGTTVWMMRSAVLVRGAHAGEDVVVAQYDDATERRRAKAELTLRAITDPLTGLRNRRAFDETIIEWCSSDSAGVIGIVYVDLDGFKRINDAHGHAMGDAILAEAARSLSRVADPPNSVYRVGGDEFIVLVPAAEAEQVADLAETITRALTGRYGETVRVTLTASVGWTHGPVADAEELLRAADADMYRRKSQRSRVRSDGE